jgi:O-acetylserine/cysteine efflux transporter
MKPLHIALAVMVAAVWGVNFVVIHIGLEHYPPILFSALRFTFAGLPLAFFLKRPDVPWRIILGIGLFLGIIKFTLLFVGMDIGVPSGLASLVLQAQVFFTVILAAFVFRDVPTGQQIVGIFIAFLGLGLISLTVDNTVKGLGLALVVAAALSWSVSNLLMRTAGQVDMMRLMVHVCTIPPIPLFMMSVLFEGWDRDVAALSAFSWAGAGAVLFNSYIVTVVGFGIWGMLIRNYGASKVVPFALLVPVFGMSSSALLLGEEFGPLRLLAGGFVIVGLILTVMKRLPFLRAPKTA